MLGYLNSVQALKLVALFSTMLDTLETQMLFEGEDAWNIYKSGQLLQLTKYGFSNPAFNSYL